jgi:type I restriction-modification system DNA methylase subunit
LNGRAIKRIGEQVCVATFKAVDPAVVTARGGRGNGETARRTSGDGPIERRLWAAADELRANSRLRSSEYSVPVLGLIFLRYADIPEVMEAVRELLNRSIAAEPYVIRDAPADYASRTIDLSQIDFEALRAKLLAGHKRIEAERLRALLSAKLAQMLQVNRGRIDYLEKLQRMIDEYNAGSLNVEEFFERLVAFARELDAEDKRASPSSSRRRS